MANTKPLQGFLLINKRPGMSSFQAIAAIKDVVGDDVRIGHAGTLDLFAQGLLVVCLSRKATKFVPTLMEFPKEYIIRARFGQLTDTLDHTGTVTMRHEGIALTAEAINGALAKLGGGYLQTPPIFSALKHNGRPLYKIARYRRGSHDMLEGVAQQKAKRIDIYESELLGVDGCDAWLRFVVSKGTYIRSLANDLAQLMGTHATTYELTRTRVGNLSLDIALDAIAPHFAEQLPHYLLSEEDVMAICG